MQFLVFDVTRTADLQASLVLTWRTGSDCFQCLPLSLCNFLHTSAEKKEALGQNVLHSLTASLGPVAGGGGKPPHSSVSLTLALLDATVRCLDVVVGAWQGEEGRDRVTSYKSSVVS